MENPYQENATKSGQGPNIAGSPLFFPELCGLLRYPQRILLLWNWKSAWLSVALRAPIFIATAVQRGFNATVAAVATESVFCMITAGFYGAITQSLRNAEPEWLTVVFLTVVVPAFFQVIEFVLHRWHGTPHLRIAEIVSVCVSAVSSFFNWYAMRRGALLVGGEGGTFGSDLRRLPGLLLQFVAALPLWLKQRRQMAESHSTIRQGSGSAD